MYLIIDCQILNRFSTFNFRLNEEESKMKTLSILLVENAFLRKMSESAKKNYVFSLRYADKREKKLF